MSEVTIYILLIALVADWFWGEPEILWSRVPHPVVVFGKAINWLERSFNIQEDENAFRYRKGAVGISALIIVAVAAGLLLEFVFGWLPLGGFVVEAFVVFTLIAQRSLMDHVGAVATGLRENGVEGGRKAVALIVGRNPDVLDRTAVSRASIESLAENFSDGVVAPAFWYLVFGLPGLFAYKMINTADSMIGYHSERYEYFGKAAAKIDDLANWIPARLSALLIVCGALLIVGPRAARNSLATAFRDAGLHRSPNAGWPESAMAGAADYALGGPRFYPAETIQQSYLNASGKRVLDAPEIDRAIGFVEAAFFVGVVLVAVLALLA
ncbi:MAG: adenosylcobinamide-phosphate synthase CbiB [Salaquimonas sp.]